jgi:SAM-dependent methyltransferase
MCYWRLVRQCKMKARLLAGCADQNGLHEVSMSQSAERAEKVVASWSRLYAARNELLKRYRRVWDIPIRDNATQVLLESLSPGARVLEIGSSDRHLEPLLAERDRGLVYKSMDVDRETRQDYYSLDDVKESFDAALLFEVIEHLPFAESLRLLAKIHDLLTPGGTLLLTTPNLAHPTHFYRDPTHLTPWSHEGLGGALLSLGYRVDRMYRIYDAPAMEKLLHKYLAAPLHRFLNVDFTHTLVVVASRCQ